MTRASLPCLLERKALAGVAGAVETPDGGVEALVLGADALLVLGRGAGRGVRRRGLGVDGRGGGGAGAAAVLAGDAGGAHAVEGGVGRVDGLVVLLGGALDGGPEALGAAGRAGLGGVGGGDSGRHCDLLVLESDLVGDR